MHHIHQHFCYIMEHPAFRKILEYVLFEHMKIGIERRQNIHISAYSAVGFVEMDIC